MRGNLLGGLLAFLLLLGVWILAALFLTSAAASPLEFPFNLKSELAADYQADPVGARIYGLRLSIVQGLGGGGEGQQQEPIPDSLKELMSQPVPSATPRPATPKPSQEPGAPTAEAPTATTVPTETPSLTPVPTLVPTVAPTFTATSGAVAMSEGDPECALLTFAGVWIDGHDDLRARVRNNNHSRAYLTATLFEWPDVPSPAYVDWLDFGTHYTYQNDYSSPTSSEGTWIWINPTSTKYWTAHFNAEPAEGIYGGFKVTLTFEYPGWGSCVLEGSAYKAQPPTLTPSLTKTPTRTRTPTSTRTPTPTKTNTPVASPSATWTTSPEAPTDTPVPPSDTPVPPTDTPVPSDTPEPPTDTPEPTATT